MRHPHYGCGTRATPRWSWNTRSLPGRHRRCGTEVQPALADLVLPRCRAKSPTATMPARPHPQRAGTVVNTIATAEAQWRFLDQRSPALPRKSRLPESAEGCATSWRGRPAFGRHLGASGQSHHIHSVTKTTKEPAVRRLGLRHKHSDLYCNPSYCPSRSNLSQADLSSSDRNTASRSPS